MKHRLSILGMIFVMIMVGLVRADTIYVTPDGAEGGGNWSTPSSLANALTLCTAADEIWLAEGTYTNSATFTVGADRTLYGGFTTGMATRAERDWTAYPVILDGQAANRRVVTVSGANVLLDGLVITNSLGAAAGGIKKAVAGALTLANCRLVNHTGGTHGIGGSFTAGSVVMTNCLVAKNVENNYYVYGWGVYSSGADLELVDCEFSNNSLVNYRCSSGLGLYFDKGTLRAWRTDWINNIGPITGVGFGGAGVYLGNAANTVATFSNCVFRGNAAHGENVTQGVGGAMYVNMHASATARVVNCTFTANTNRLGHGGAIALSSGTLILKNSILWSNEVGAAYTGSEIYRTGGTLDISYCDLTGLESPHVVGAALPQSCRSHDPLFASATDLHLQSKAGRWDAAFGDFVTTDPDYSHCIDTGDPTDSIGDEPTDNDNVRINMGRYGGTAEASKSPPTIPPLLADRSCTVSYDHVRISGELTNTSYLSAQVYLCYGTSEIIGDTTNGWDTVVDVGIKQNGTVFSTWTPALLPETTYHYRWHAVNAEGSDWTDTASFTTGPVAPGGGANVIHVDRLATGSGDGGDWAHAYTRIEDAVAGIGGARTNLWITGGTYAEFNLITLPQSTTVIGGFVGTETTLPKRTLTNAVGVITNYTIINGQGLHPCLSITSGDVLLESLVLSNGLSAASGCGIAKVGSGALTMVNCQLVANTGGRHGVGGYFAAGTVLMTNCLVANNIENNYYVYGWGIYSSGANLEVVDCVISNQNKSIPNHRACYGLGLYFDNGTLRIYRTDFIDNKGPATAGGGGAAVYLGNNAKTSATFSNCLFRGNEAEVFGSSGYGGAMYLNLAAAAKARVVNCTFTDNANLSGNGGAIYLKGGTLVLKNAILWSNEVGSAFSGSEIYKDSGTLDISTCALTGLESPYVVGAIPPETCQVIDPLFASTTDLHLQSPAGRWDPASGDFVTTDSNYSRCIDAGDPIDLIGDEPTDNGNIRINLGRYGGTAEASKSPPTIPPLLADRGYTVSHCHVLISGELTNTSFVAAQVTLCYGTSAVMGDTTNGWDAVIGVGEKNNGTVFSTWTPALLPETTYYYRWYAVNSGGSNWTDAASFKTGTAGAGGGVNVIHVDRLATGAADGGDWAHAYNLIGDAVASIGGTRTNIWITGGTYGEVDLLTLSQSTTVIGGFVGTESALSERTLTNVVGVVTNYTIIDGLGLHPCLSITAGDVFLESLVITNGRSSASGCGIAKTSSGSLTMANCHLVNHTGSGHGIGGYFAAGSVLMTNCIVANNTENSYYKNGWGVYSVGADLELVDCEFSNNSLVNYRCSSGLGLYFDKGTLRAWRTGWINNIGPANSGCGGAGVYLGNTANTAATFSNCVFRGNVAKQGDGMGGVGYGTAMYLNMHASTTARVVNCTFTANTNLLGHGGAIALNGGTLVLKNSILWSNAVGAIYSGSEIYRTGGTLIADHCDLTGVDTPYVVGDATLTNCISVEPLFASATDVHLQSRRGRWHPETAAWVTDPETSPCVDAGDPTDPVGLEPLPHGKIINLGTYGGTAQASLTYRPLGTLLLLR